MTLLPLPRFKRAFTARSLAPIVLFALACSDSKDETPSQPVSGAPGAAGTAGTGIAGAPAGGAGSPAGGTGGSGVAGSTAAGRSGAGAGGASGGASGGSGGAQAGAGWSAAGSAGASSGAGGSGGSGGAGGASGGSGGGSGSGEFKLTAPWEGDETCTPQAKDTCPDIPVAHRYTNIGGMNQRPPLSWTAGPTGTQSYAIVLQDLSYPATGPHQVHWAMWNIPATTTSLAPDATPQGAEQAALIGTTWVGSGACGNVYELIVYALDVAPYAPPSGQGPHTRVRDQLEDDAGDLVLARDVVRGTTKNPCNNQN